MTKTVYRRVDTNEEAIALGFPNIATYRHAVRMEMERDARQAYADAIGRHNAELAAQLQGQSSGHIMRTSPLTMQQAEAARARDADRSGRGDGQ